MILNIYAANLSSLILRITSVLIEALQNRVFILTMTAWGSSMIVKGIINSIKAGKITTKDMASYGGMPSCHTAFVMAVVYGVALDDRFGWKHPLLVVALVLASIVLVDTIRFRGNVDQLNRIIRNILKKQPELEGEIKPPKMIAHKTSEVIGGAVYSFIYSCFFYVFFWHLF
ncbi:MAG: divergent PAP2 family protein [Spirochaetes bacterium]|nr:divergent PAP2 family protein [Spirochaetota bacterium]